MPERRRNNFLKFKKPLLRVLYVEKIEKTCELLVPPIRRRDERITENSVCAATEENDQFAERATGLASRVSASFVRHFVRRVQRRHKEYSRNWGVDPRVCSELWYSGLQRACQSLTCDQPSSTPTRSRKRKLFKKGRSEPNSW